MKRNFIPVLIICMICSISLFGQKKEKVVPATQSALTVLPLPEGSQQDKRGLSTFTAKVLFEMESKKAGVGVKTPEVFLLPPVSKSHYNADSLVGSLQSLGWAIQPVQGDAKFAWLQKDNRYVMAYFSMGKNGTDLYLAETQGIPAIPAVSGPVVSSSGQGQPGMPQGTGMVVTAPGQGQPNSGNQMGNNPGDPLGNPGGNPVTQNTTGAPVVSISANSSQNNIPTTGGFVYHTTNFDDGWTSAIAVDKVIVTKGSLRVFIYQTVVNSDASGNLDNRDWAWQHIISRDFTIRNKQYRDNGRSSEVMIAPYIEGQAIEKSSGRNVFIAMYVLSASNQINTTLAIAPDEQTIRNAFPKADDKFDSDLHAMREYNRFSVDARDLIGTWAGNSGAGMSSFDVYSGNLLGMSAAEVSDKFVFANNSAYTSKHTGGTGQVGGSQKFQQEYKGNYTADKWSMTMSNRFEGKTDHYNCYFEVVKGGRILHLQNKQYTGTWYHLVKTN